MGLQFGIAEALVFVKTTFKFKKKLILKTFLNYIKSKNKTII